MTEKQKEKFEKTRKEKRQLYEKSKVSVGKKETTINLTKKVARNKKPIYHRGRNKDDDINKTKNAKDIPVKTNNISKKVPFKGKAGDKKVKKEKKKDEEEKRDDITKTTEKEVKKGVVMEDKSIIIVPEELKENNTLLSIYFMLKGKYLNIKKRYEILLYNPTIYKSFRCNLHFLLDDKKQELQEKITEIESFLYSYNDLEIYLTKDFSPSKTEQNALLFIKKKDILDLIKKGEIPNVINNLFKLLLIIFDIEFDETLENENLLNYFIAEVMDKNDVKDLRTFEINYLSTYNDLRMSKKKVKKINAIVDSDEKVFSSSEIAKISKNISYSTMFLRNCYDYLNSKTLDDVPYYELRAYNKLLQEYKDKLSVLEKGPQTNIEEVAKEKIDENNIENQKYLELQKLLMEEKNKNNILNEQIKKLQIDLNNEKDLKNKLNIQLEEANNKIRDLSNQLSNNINNIQNNKILELQRIIDMKNQEISQLYGGINTNNNGIKFMPGDNIIGIGFNSVNQKIQNYSRAYKDTEIVARIEEELYNEYPEFRDNETYLMVKGNKIMRFKTLKENNIKNGDIIQVHIYEDEI